MAAVLVHIDLDDGRPDSSSRIGADKIIVALSAVAVAPLWSVVGGVAPLVLRHRALPPRSPFEPTPMPTLDRIVEHLALHVVPRSEAS